MIRGRFRDPALHWILVNGPTMRIKIRSVPDAMVRESSLPDLALSTLQPQRMRVASLDEVD
jgi:hypothetical protein